MLPEADPYISIEVLITFVLYSMNVRILPARPMAVMGSNIV